MSSYGSGKTYNNPNPRSYPPSGGPVTNPGSGGRSYPPSGGPVTSGGSGKRR